MKNSDISITSYSWPLGILAFVAQFIISAVLFIHNIIFFNAVTYQGIAPFGIENVFYNFLELISFTLIVAASTIFLGLKFISKWDFSFEAEIVKVFLCFFWGMLFFFFIFMRPV